MNHRNFIKIILLLVLLTAIPKKTTDLIARPLSQCPGNITCPDHNMVATFDGLTKQVWDWKKSKYCTYGEYKHAAPPDSEHKTVWTHKFYDKCGCD